MKKKRKNQKHDNQEMENFTSKGKHTEDIVNHLCRKLVGRIKGKSSKIIYIHSNQVEIHKTVKCKI